ncbi:alpha/beta hydrolase [Salinimicrobium sp. TH3]|uniref:alpha/beta hydrolase n=1 Tax=Salinimicrobium sp. TH3 TaxID=2997342 RepID=UPI0022733916|nr:alpha/beta hydrolase [Salinimicrobium sp. TH3]MCY2686806.1 alpha/beta fold hydrolase [Salinimicrobium sp. TH3]
MKKTLKVVGVVILILILFTAGAGFYFYKTDPMVKAIVDNDESKLYYFPVKEMEDMNDLKYSETILRVEDSLNIYSYYFQAATEEPKGNIFFIHGAGGNVSKYKVLIKPLVENGYGVYTVDWRGYGNSTGKPGYKGVLKDTEVAFADFKNKTESDSLKMIVYGTSLGGQLAVKITADNQNEIDALVLDGSIQSAQQMAIDYAPVDFLKEKARKNPKNFNQDYVAIRDIKEISNTPKLIIHSQLDRDVSFIQGENLYEAAKEPKEFWITDTKHIMTLKEHPNEAIQRIDELIR